jgi:hypothetical protein
MTKYSDSFLRQERSAYSCDALRRQLCIDGERGAEVWVSPLISN